MLARVCSVAVMLVLAQDATAQSIDFGGVSGVFKSRITQGLAWRLEPQDPQLIYKNNLNKNLCGFTDQDSCYRFDGNLDGARKLIAAPGSFYAVDRDDGNMNYGQGSLVSAPTKFSTEFSGHYKDLSFKIGALAYFDPRNYRFTQTHWDDIVDTRCIGGTGPSCEGGYVPGQFQPYRDPRPKEISNSSGKEWILTDALVGGQFAVLGQDFSFNAGYQTIRWGESTFVAINSLSEINAPDARLAYQPGTQVAEIFRPTPALTISTNLTDNTSADLVYIFGWDKVHTPAGGEFYGFYDFITKDVGLESLGQFHEDPNRRQRLPGIGGLFSDTSMTLPTNTHVRARDQGQFGARLNWFSDFNGGTQFGFYALNYHSRLPILSFTAADATCIKEGTEEIVQAIADCKGFKTAPNGLEAYPIDTVKVFFEYPEDIQMFGASFNTNVGSWSLAGELSWRPNLPIQVQVPDALMAAIQPALPAHDLCLGITSAAASLFGIPNNAPPSCRPPDLGAVGGALPYLGEILGSTRGQQMIGLLLSNPRATYLIPSRRTAVPDNISRYRGYVVQPHQYVSGFERLNALQVDISGVRALSSTENPFGADQVLIVAELGAMYFPDMPPLSQAQFEAGYQNETHYSPGADGSGDPAGTPQGLTPEGAYAASRFTPTMQRTGFATPFSTGYRLMLRFEYDNLLNWGFNYKPQIVFSHDVYGRSPQPVQNFVQGVKTWQINNELELSSEWSVQLFYSGSTGGWSNNALRDKDTAGVSFSYVF